MALLDRSQLDVLQYARIGILGFTANGADDVVTTAITTALSGAGEGGVSVPLQLMSATAPGVVTTGTDNIVLIASNGTKKPISDSSSNEVYGRLTEASGVYTLSYFTLVAGVETAHSFAANTSIDFYFTYQFDFARMPRNAGVAIGSRMIQNDPSNTSSFLGKHEKLTVTALNTLSALSIAPLTATSIRLDVNGKVENPFGGASAAFSVSGTTVTWSSANAKYDLKTTFDVVAFFW